MKIGEIEVGKTYGILDSPQSTRRRSWGRNLPRKFKVTEIVTVQENRRSGGYYGNDKVVNVKRVKGKVLDGGGSKRGYSYDKIERAGKGAVLVIEARQVVAPWEGKLAAEVEGKIKFAEASAELQKTTEKRLTALLGKSPSRREAYITTSKRWGSDDTTPQAELRISDKELETLLSLAEKGKGL